MGDALLATKLHVPRPRPGFVARPRLTAQLDKGLDGRLILVCAPAGFGKTSLLSAWASGGTRPAGWLSLDGRDNDPARFWRHVTAALDRVCPGISERIAPLFEPPAPSSFDGIVAALVNELTAVPSGLLILDDYHLIKSPTIHDTVAYLVSHLPHGICVVIATRADAPLRLGSLRARGELIEVRTNDLRFTAGEAAILLADGSLSSASVEALTTRTEGWVAGLQLAGLSLDGRDADAFVAAFSGSHRFVLDYLTEEVLDRLEPAVRDFLLQTSVADRLCGDLCDALTGRTDSQSLLERVERAGIFLTPLDEVRGWWRYHHLFRDLLRARLRAERPGLAPALHRAAAVWHAGHGLGDEAIGHALAAGETDMAADLIEQHFDAVYFTGENATLRRWLAGLPPDLIRRRTRLNLIEAFIALTASDLGAASRAIQALDGQSAPAGDFRPSSGVGGSLIANVPAASAITRAWFAYLNGDAERMGESAAIARTELNDDESVLISVYQLNIALAAWLSGRLPEAELCFRRAIDWWLAAGFPVLAAQGCNYLGQIRRAQGDLDGALAAFGELVAIAARSPGVTSPVAGIGHVGLADIHYQRGDLAAACKEVAAGLPLCRQLSDTQALASGLATRAWILQAEGQTAQARRAMMEAAQAGPSPAVTDLLNPVPAHQARLLLAQEDIEAAARWASTRSLAPDDKPAYARERDYLVLARVMIAQGDAAAALVLLGRLLSLADRQGRAASAVEIRALRALALAASGDRARGIEELTSALVLASAQGFVRVFADEGSPMSELLGAVLAAHRDGQDSARRVPLNYLAQVLRAAAAPSRDQAGDDSLPAGFVEPLTRREQQVLELLAAGAPNLRISDELVVTLDTVKKHVTHVLAKLGAGNRTEAVARARALGVIG